MTHPALTPEQRTQLEEAALQHGLGAFTQHAIELARPRLLLRTGDPWPDAPIGATRLGGAPDLPADVPWPGLHDDEDESEPMIFLAQLHLDSLPVPPDWPLPSTGWLHFFKGDGETRDTEHAVLYTPPGAALVRRDLPELDEVWSDDEHLPPTKVDLSHHVELPFESGAEPYERPPAELTDSYEAFVEAFELPEDRLEGAAVFGWDNDVDTRPSLQMAGWELGAAKSLDHEWMSANADEIRTLASNWAPLFRMTSNLDLGLQMGDYYTLQFYIRWDDLAALRFDRTWAHQLRD